MEYAIYTPRERAPGDPLLVAVLGSSSRRLTHIEALVESCERSGVVLLAPAMATPDAAPFQQLGRGAQRSDLFLHQCLRELNFLCDIDVARFRLLGYSGGAQFGHRYLMAYPDRVEGAVLAAAGWYTFPDTSQRFPHGIRSTRRLPGLAFNPEAYLRVPVTVVIGAEDTDPARMRSSARIDAQQGSSRLERARRWVAAMQAQAQAHGLQPQVDLLEVAGVGHSFKALCEHGAILDQAIPARSRRVEH